MTTSQPRRYRVPNSTMFLTKLFSMNVSPKEVSSSKGVRFLFSVGRDLCWLAPNHSRTAAAFFSLSSQLLLFNLFPPPSRIIIHQSWTEGVKRLQQLRRQLQLHSSCWAERQIVEDRKDISVMIFQLVRAEPESVDKRQHFSIDEDIYDVSGPRSGQFHEHLFQLFQDVYRVILIYLSMVLSILKVTRKTATFRYLV